MTAFCPALPHLRACCWPTMQVGAPLGFLKHILVGWGHCTVKVGAGSATLLASFDRSSRLVQSLAQCSGGAACK